MKQVKNGDQTVRAFWIPQPKQAKFQSLGVFEALYGGAAGGGKSDALLAEATRQVNIPTYRAIIFRKTVPQLEALISRSQEMYSVFNARYNANDKCWKFPSGAKIFFGYMDRESDKLKYQGKSYDFIGFDELTHFTWTQYSYMFSRCRPSGEYKTRCYIRATTNPGGRGHGWVKDRFIIPCKGEKIVWDKLEVVNPKNNKTVSLWKSRTFIASSVFDNQALLDNDPAYVATLAMLPEKERNALLYGDWDSFDGQVFTQFRDEPEHYIDRKWTHVIAPFLIPDDWRIYRALDWGFSHPFSVGWYAVDYEGKIYRIREFYGWNGTPDTGLQMTPQEVAKRIREIETTDINMQGRKIYAGPADSAIWNNDGLGVTIAEAFEKCFVYWERSSKDRFAGKMQCHYRLAFNPKGIPMFYVFNTCKQFIRTIPTLVYDPAKAEDVDTKQEDHIYDEWRYMMMSNPIDSRRNYDKKARPLNDPLDLYTDIDYSNIRDYTDTHRINYEYEEMMI